MVFTIHTPKSTTTETNRTEAVAELSSTLLLTPQVVDEKHARATADVMITRAETQGSCVEECEDYNVTVTVLREEF